MRKVSNFVRRADENRSGRLVKCSYPVRAHCYRARSKGHEYRRDLIVITFITTCDRRRVSLRGMIIRTEVTRARWQLRLISTCLQDDYDRPTGPGTCFTFLKDITRETCHEPVLVSLCATTR